MITAKFDSRSVEAALREIGQRAEHARPFFEALKRPLKDDQGEHRRDKEGPDGPWPKRTRSNRRRRRRRLLGKLPTAVKYRATDDDVVGISRARWSQAHQEGANVGRGGKTKLPARPFLWLSFEFLRDATEAALDYISRNWGRKP